MSTPSHPERPVSATDSLANERTFLAWVRTGIAIMAFGFVAVKFSLFIHQIAILVDHKIALPDAVYSYWFGLGLVILGTIMSLLAFMRYRQVENQLNEKKYRSNTLLSLLLTTCILFAGVLLLVYLI
jgi:putative membrane protein